MAVIKKGPDGSGSMGGHDPEKYGPIRSLLKYYAKKPKIFTACVRDNRKRFGPRVNAVCAWVKDQIKGTTKWRGKEADLRAELGLEGLTEAEIDMYIFDMDTMESIVFPPSQAEAVKFCEANGIDYDIHGFDEPCPACGDWGDCGCVALQEAMLRHNYARQLQARDLVVVMSESDAANNPISEKSDNSYGEKDDEKHPHSAVAPSQMGATNSSAKSGGMSPREVARPENGTIVYDDGSIKDTKTGLTRYPSTVFPDGSVRYDDGTVARPGSLASMIVMRPMNKEDRAELNERGAQGMPVQNFASVDTLMNDLTKHMFKTTGKGGAGELPVDKMVQDELAAGAGVSGEMKVSPPADPVNARKPSDPSHPSMESDDYDVPLRPRRGEEVARGPEGGRGVWRNVDGYNIFIKIGQTPREARAEQSVRDKEKTGK